jgi:hypothetical protein
MHRHRWWIAIVATLLTPWIGPHVDRYVPMGWVLLRAGTGNADRGFWLMAAAAVGVLYLVWFALFSGIAAWFARRRRARGSSGADGTRS